MVSYNWSKFSGKESNAKGGSCKGGSQAEVMINMGLKVAQECAVKQRVWLQHSCRSRPWLQLRPTLNSNLPKLPNYTLSKPIETACCLYLPCKWQTKFIWGASTLWNCSENCVHTIKYEVANLGMQKKHAILSPHFSTIHLWFFLQMIPMISDPWARAWSIGLEPHQNTPTNASKLVVEFVQRSRT